MKIIKVITIISFTLFNLHAFSQIDLDMPVAKGKGGVATTIVKDYETLGINPSNLGWSNNKRFSVGILNWGVQAKSKAFDFKELTSAFTKPDEPFTSEQKQIFSDIFAEDGLNLSSHLNWVGLSASFDKYGGIAINLRDRAAAHCTANNNFADIAFNGFNADLFKDSTNLTKTVSEIFDGTKLNLLHFREFNIAYGIKLFSTKNSSGHNLSLYAGVGYKYLWGLGYVDIRAENGVLTAISSIEKSSYNVNMGAIENYKINKPDGMFNAAGTGQAWDFGASLIIDDKFKFGASVIDMGSITWNKNVLIGKDTLLTLLDSTQIGLNSFEMKNQAGYLFNEGGIISFTEGKSFKTDFPAKLRCGAGIVLSENFEIGADMMIPLSEANGNLSNAYFAIGGEMKIFANVRISSGVAGNKSYGLNVPFGLTIGTLFGITELYIATNDVLTYFGRSSNPALSFAIGVLRFNINKKDVTPATK